MQTDEGNRCSMEPNDMSLHQGRVADAQRRVAENENVNVLLKKLKQEVTHDVDCKA